MTFEEWMIYYHAESPMGELGEFGLKVWDAAQTAERERIKSRVKEAAESIWAVRDLVDNRYGLYIGPPLNTLEQFVEKLVEET